MEDNINKNENGRQPNFFLTKQDETSIKMEADIKKWEKMEDELKKMEDNLKTNWKTT